MKKRRLVLSLKRLGYESQETVITIPFRVENQSHILQEIQELLTKFGFLHYLSNETKRDVENFYREESLFGDFSLKAESIKNDEFNKYPDLVDKFETFQNTLKSILKRELYPLQLLSAFHMAFAQNSCNFAVPGAGKTSVVYGAYTYLKSLSKDDPKYVEKLLIIGPLSSFAPWENEYQECFGETTTFQRLSGDINISRDKKLEHLYSGNPAEITLIFHGGVDALQRDIMEFLKRNRTMVVVDEAHSIKNPEGIWGQSVVEISKEATARVILTGTPVPNGYQDLFNLYRFIYPFKYKDILRFHYQNLEDMTKNNSLSSERIETLKNNISPFFLRIKKSDLDLPPIKEQIVKVNMNSHHREIYDFIEMEYIKSFKINSSATVKDVLNKAKLIRLRQASTNPALLAKPLKDSLANNLETGEFDPNSVFTTYNDEFINDSEFFFKICNYSNQETPKKFSIIKEILEDRIIGREEKAIVWTIFIQNAKEFQNYLLKSNISSELLIGEVPQSDREKIIEKFNDPDNMDFQVVIANPFSVAESISLHKGCHNAIYMERDYNCSNFLQSKDRIHRVGLYKSQITNYYYIVSRNSIDEIIDNRLRVKIERMEQIINDDIPLFRRIDDEDETDLIKELMKAYARKS